MGIKLLTLKQVTHIFYSRFKDYNLFNARKLHFLCPSDVFDLKSQFLSRNGVSLKNCFINVPADFFKNNTEISYFSKILKSLKPRGRESGGTGKKAKISIF